MRLSNWPLRPKKREVEVQVLCSTFPGTSSCPSSSLNHAHRPTQFAPTANQIAKMLYSSAQATEAHKFWKIWKEGQRDSRWKTRTVTDVKRKVPCCVSEWKQSFCVCVCVLEREFVRRSWSDQHNEKFIVSWANWCESRKDDTLIY